MRKMARALEASERERRDLLAKLAPDAKRSGRQPAEHVARRAKKARPTIER